MFRCTLRETWLQWLKQPGLGPARVTRDSGVSGPWLVQRDALCSGSTMRCLPLRSVQAGRRLGPQTLPLGALSFYSRKEAPLCQVPLMYLIGQNRVTGSLGARHPGQQTWHLSAHRAEESRGEGRWQWCQGAQGNICQATLFPGRYPGIAGDVSSPMTSMWAVLWKYTQGWGELGVWDWNIYTTDTCLLSQSSPTLRPHGR